MVAFTTRMPIGFPGRISRTDDRVVETHIIDANTPPAQGFGKFVKLVAGLIQPVVSGTAADIDGICVAPFPIQSTTTDLGTAPAVPTSGLIDVLKRGYVVVNVARGTPVAGGVVALRVTAGAYTAGDIEGDGTNVSGGDTNCVAVTNAYWMGPKDASNNAELAYNI